MSVQVSLIYPTQLYEEIQNIEHVHEYNIVYYDVYFVIKIQRKKFNLKYNNS